MLKKYQVSSIHLVLKDEKATKKLARKIVNVLLSLNSLIYFSGEVGSGKTTFIREILMQSGIKEKIKSPSFSLCEYYYIEKHLFYHFDFYRLSNQNDFFEFGFNHIIETKLNITRGDEITVTTLVEWPEIFEKYLPKSDLTINIYYEQIGRSIKLTANTDTGVRILNHCI